MIDTRECPTAKRGSFARAPHSHCGKGKIPVDILLRYDGKKEYEKIGQLIEQGFAIFRIGRK